MPNYLGQPNRHDRAAANAARNAAQQAADNLIKAGRKQTEAEKRLRAAKQSGDRGRIKQAEGEVKAAKGEVVNAAADAGRAKATWKNILKSAFK